MAKKKNSKKKEKKQQSPYQLSLKNLKKEKRAKWNLVKSYPKTLRQLKPLVKQKPIILQRKGIKNKISNIYQQARYQMQQGITPEEYQRLKNQKQVIIQRQEQQIKKARKKLYSETIKEYSPTYQTLRATQEELKQQGRTAKAFMQPYSKETRSTGAKIGKGITSIYSALSSLGGMFGSKDENISSGSAGRGRPSGSYLPQYQAYGGVLGYKRFLAEKKRRERFAEFQQMQQQERLKQQRQSTSQENLQSAGKTDYNMELTEQPSNEVNPDYNIDLSGLDVQEPMQQQPVYYQQPMNQQQQRAYNNLQKIRYINSLKQQRGKEPMFRENDLSEGNGFGLKSRWKINFGFSPFKNSTTPFKNKTNDLMKSNKPSDEELQYKRDREKYGLSLSTRNEQRYRRLVN
jgi:hypothetical protein